MDLNAIALPAGIVLGVLGIVFTTFARRLAPIRWDADGVVSEQSKARRRSPGRFRLWSIALLVIGIALVVLSIAGVVH